MLTMDGWLLSCKVCPSVLVRKAGRKEERKKKTDGVDLTGHQAYLQILHR
jgi:hypothetical protein